MVHAAVRAGGAVGRAVPGPAGRRRLDLTTPGRLWLVLVVLVLLSLAWGALAAFTAVRYASAASSVVTAREPLSLSAQQIYAHLSDANDAAATAFLTGGIEPAATRNRYLADISAASSGIESATAQIGPGSGSAGRNLAALAAGLPAYTQEMGNADADYRLAVPLGAAYLREASALMRGTLLPNAKGLYAAENASLRGTSAQATGLPLVCVTVAAGLVACLVLYRASRWLRARTNRVLNAGLVAAGVLAVVSLAWLGAAYLGARGDLLDAQARGSATVEAAAQVVIAAQEAHADESLTLIDNTGDDSYQADYTKQEHQLGTLLTAAAGTARGTPAGPATAAAAGDARAWFAAHAQVRSLDDNGNHAEAVASVLGTGRGDAGASFARLSADLTGAINSDQAVFDATARSASGAYTGVEPVVIGATLLMAAACAWGLSRRLAEYQ